MNNISVGMTDRLSGLGTADPKKYLLRFPGMKGGNYRMEHTPHELATLIGCLRTGGETVRSMLCIGTNTLGAERAVAENTGVLTVDIDVKERTEAIEENKRAMEEADITVRYGAQEDVYDVVLVAGNLPVDMDFVWRKARKGGFVGCLGTSFRMDWGNLRKVWASFRNGGHRQLMQTGPAYGEVGLGLVQIQHRREGWDTQPKEAEDAVQEQSTGKVDAGEQAEDGQEVVSGNPEGQEATEEGKPEEVKRWAKAHTKCVMCGGTEKPHMAKGFCRGCYPKRPKA